MGSVAKSLACLSSLFIASTTTAPSFYASAAFQQKQILRHVYNGLNGDNWEKITWDFDDDECNDFDGVVCNSAGHIIEINLPNNNMAGDVPPHVYTLPFLKSLDFSKNRITNAGWDKLDDVLTGDTLLANVQSIDLTNNMINTVEGVTKLKDSLTGLHMTYNNLKGPMPRELFELTNLEILAISENSIEGKIDTRLGRLTNLLEFYCYGNKVTGEIPSEIGLLTKLQILTFAENKLEGTLPEEIRNMGNLRTFSVHNNNPGSGSHTGTIPRFDRHPFLNEIYLDGNAFKGGIPPNFLHAYNGTSGETVTIGLSNNQLTGKVPVTLLKFDSLVLNAVGNQLTGFDSRICGSKDINAWMNGLVELYGCDAILCPVGYYSDTGRQEEEGTPCKLCDAPTEFLGETKCASDVPSASEEEQLEILAEFYLALEGPKWTEKEGWNVFVQMESHLDLTLPNYQEMNIKACKFHGVTCEGGKVIAVDLPNNGLEGMVPSSFWDLTTLKELDLSGNEVSLDRDYGFGDMGNAGSLRKVDLSSNDIQIFDGIGRCESLEELYLDDAYLFSSLDPELYTLKRLKKLHMQFSGLTGTITSGINALKNLMALNLYGNELTGKIPHGIGEMPKLWHIDFSENDMTGTIPADQFAKLLDLEKFHIHQAGRGGSGITGPLPSFKELTKLHMLDVNSNMMTGSIPEDFLSGVANFSRPMEINIGYNQFTGTVPETLKRFIHMRFDAVKNKLTMVNPALCNRRDWFNEDVGHYIDKGGNGCDAILCPVKTYNDFGRARTDAGGDCKPCPSGRYIGQVTCDGQFDEDTTATTVEIENLEKKILDKLYYESGGPSWTKSNGWTEGFVCDYEGVTCLTQGGNEGVVELNLAGFGLTASVTTDIYLLPSLKKVDFSNNDVDLSFDGIDQALTLEEIRMDDADLTSMDGISSAPVLKRLHIARNSFPAGSEIPDDLYSATSLTRLAMSYNGFEGTIKPDISNLRDLEEFWCSSNDITGSIPTEFGGLPQLTSLVLNGNRLSGQIPEELNNIPNLHQLHLQRQRDFGGFSGPVPNFKTSPHLKDLDISGNSLTGSIPEDFMETVRTSDQHSDYAYPKIELSDNQITGAIPDNFDDWVGLFINLAGNRITAVPDVLCDDDDEFMGGLVGKLTVNKCNAILCPPGTFTGSGRQPDAENECQPCSGSTEVTRRKQAPFYGSTKCAPLSGDRKTLEELHGLIFTGASEDTYWMSDNPICTWYGITCGNSKADHGVTEIKLESNSLTTDDPEKVTGLFFQLASLERLNIRGNSGLSLKFDTVEFPERLELLQLSATGLTSVAGIGRATKLKELHFTENDVKGPFPDEIFELVSMEKLYLSFNKISGPLPKKIGQLTDLREFYAYTNEMTGTIPEEIGNLVNIENLVLGKNKFRGSLPNSLNDLAHLKEFSVYYNKGLSGTVLPFSTVTKIEKLDLEGCQFTGQLPNNFLGGLDSTYIANSNNEIILHLADNAISGPLPQGLKDIKNLYLDIVGNKFSEVPESFCLESQSYWMNGKVGELNSCKAIACPKHTFSDSGRISEGGDNCQSCGPSEVAPFVGSYSCTKVDVEMTALKRLYDATGGSNWGSSDNWMDHTKPVCSWFGVECAGDRTDNSTITEINLPNNNLDGTMPQMVFAMPALKNLNLKENNIFMTFANIVQAKSLENLYISDIDLGSIKGIGKAPALRELHLTANKLTGEIPNDFYDLSDTMEYLYIAYNSFSGPLSPKFGKFTKLRDFYAYDNEFTGTLPSQFAALPNLQNLVLAENKLSGTISEDFSYMPQLSLFSAYRRLKAGPKLTGPLPSFSNVPKLMALYLDYNHLAGTIPSNFLKSSLSPKLRVTISHNLLSGPVPNEMLVLNDLNIEMEGNKITKFDERFCDNLSWQNGLVSQYGCDSYMCQPGHYSKYGRQNSTDSPCTKCDASTNPTPYWGSTSCDSVVDEREILELLFSECGGEDWHHNDNWLGAEAGGNDDICTWYGVECRNGNTVQAIRLGANNLVGTPPEELFRLHQLHTLWLHSNPIDFKFKGIGKATNLVELRLDSTGLSDVFGVGDATSLITLDLKYNQISGPFPMEILKLDKLESLSLTDNRLTGGLPDFSPLSSLISLRLGSNMFSGEPSGFSDVKYLLNLDLSDNDLVGTIPKNFLNGISARKPILVDLSSNNLSGGLPIELDRLDMLVIYLRDNKFTELSKEFCNGDNRGWNLDEVGLFGCDAIMCPPGKANYHGRHSSEKNPCLKCSSNADLYGQITCDGEPLLLSSSSRLVQGVAEIIISSLLFGLLWF